MKKKLGLATLTSLVAGNMIGSGVFLLPSTLAQLGSLSLISWLFTATGSFILALVFSRMSLLVPKTGGPYAYAQYGLGNFMGFQTAYSYWIAIWAGNAAIALAGVSYLSVFFPSLSDPIIACIVSIVFIWIFTLINIQGVHNAGFIQLVTTVLKMIPILLIATIGWFYFKPEFLTNSINVTTPHMSNFNLITHAATLTLWAFIGLESATVPADSVKNPKRDIPLATLLGTLIAMVVYITSSTTIMGMIPNANLQTSLSPFADAAEIIFGSWGKWIIAGGAVISCLGCLNGWILLQGQIPMAAARDGLFPKIFKKENSKGVPYYGLIISSILISVLLFFSISPNLVTQFKVIILTATLANLIPYLYTPVVEIILIRDKKPIKMISLITSIIGIIYSFWAILGSGQDILVGGAILILSSVPLYIFIKGSNIGKNLKL
jgi:basic amino acid/polyamine antiporter, APA family